jgi:hypothetical protein
MTAYNILQQAHSINTLSPAPGERSYEMDIISRDDNNRKKDAKHPVILPFSPGIPTILLM